ncbi:unnamed protein product [Toxocara canis]|uniref:Uncharacterized protein n=1 Tax=Toxocara canis TaxID=6265 RepID=A0A183UBA9_TOXCA|nr:unnamed protein product [Toxocara canis]
MELLFKVRWGSLRLNKFTKARVMRVSCLHRALRLSRYRVAVPELSTVQEYLSYVFAVLEVGVPESRQPSSLKLTVVEGSLVGSSMIAWALH